MTPLPQSNKSVQNYTTNIKTTWDIIRTKMWFASSTPFMALCKE